MTKRAPKMVHAEDRCTAVLDYDAKVQRGIRCDLEPHDHDISHRPGPWERMTTNEYLRLTVEWTRS